MSIKNVSIKEEKLRAFHLRNLALGNIYGPLTGKASVDKPWLKYSSEEEIEESILESAIGMKHSIAEGMSNSATKYAHLNSSRYIKSDMTYEKSKEMGDMVAKALVASGVKKGDIVGEAQYLLDGKVIGKTDIVAAKSVKKAGLWDYIKHIRKRMIKGDDYSADR